jgi:hypothetical protein
MKRRSLEPLRRAVVEEIGRAKAAHQGRDQMIRELHPRFTIRQIAEAAQLSPARVHQIISEKEQR